MSALSRPERPRVLVTGASGFIGQHVLSPLVERGFEVHAVGNSRKGTADVTWYAADLLSPGARHELLEAVDPSHLVHGAWYLDPGRREHFTSPANLDWVIASLDLVRSFQRRGGERVVTLGTCFEYAFTTSCLHESSPLGGATTYGASKVALSAAVAALAEATGLSSAWARLFYLYGPHENPRRLVADIAYSLLTDREVATSEGLLRRDYMYVVDAGEALAALLDSDVRGPVNIATGDAPPVRELVSLVAAAAGRPDLVRFGARPSDPSDPAEIRADTSRLRTEVGWDAYTPQSDAIRATVDWWRAEAGVR
jgi:nucleoside-diphosphate-sugar epimerase